MAKCTCCGHENPSDAKFCARCGTKLEKVCPKCGAKAEAGDVFCTNCGYRLAGSVTNTNPVPSPAPVIQNKPVPQPEPVSQPEPAAQNQPVSQPEPVIQPVNTVKESSQDKPVVQETPVIQEATEIVNYAAFNEIPAANTQETITPEVTAAPVMNEAIPAKEVTENIYAEPAMNNTPVNHENIAENPFAPAKRKHKLSACPFCGSYTFMETGNGYFMCFICCQGKKVKSYQEIPYQPKVENTAAVNEVPDEVKVEETMDTPTEVSPSVIVVPEVSAVPETPIAQETPIIQNQPVPQPEPVAQPANTVKESSPIPNETPAAQEVSEAVNYAAFNETPAPDAYYAGTPKVNTPEANPTGVNTSEINKAVAPAPTAPEASYTNNNGNAAFTNNETAGNAGTATYAQPDGNQKVSMNTFQNIMHIVTCSFMLVFLGILFLVVWGSAVKITADGASTEINPMYWFSDNAWQIMKSSLSSPIVYVQKVVFLFGFVVFIASIVGTYIASIISIIFVAKAVKNPEQLNKSFRPFGIAVGFASSNFILAMSTQAAKLADEEVTMLRVQPGWGFVFYIVFLAIIAVILILRRASLSTPDFSKKAYSFISATCIAVFSIAFALLAFHLSAGMSGDNEIVSFGPYYGLTIISNYAYSDFSRYATPFALGVFAYVTYALGSVGASMLIGNTVIYLGTNSKKDEKNVISFLIADGVLLLIGFVLSLVVCSQMLTIMGSAGSATVIPGVDAIVGFVLLDIGLITYGVFRYLSNNKQTQANG